MTRNQVKEAVELVAVLSIVASLIFVGLQIKQEREIAATASVAAAADGRKYMAELISENPEVWANGIAGETLTEPEATIFDALATAYELDAYASWYRASQLNHVSSENRGLRFASFLLQNPGLLDHWRSERLEMQELRTRILVEQNPDRWGQVVEDMIGQLEAVN